MIISHKWKFVFIKGRKVAGTSVEIALSEICGPHDVLTPISPPDEMVRISNGMACQNYSFNRQTEIDYIEGVKRKHIPESASSPIPVRFYNHMSLREVYERSEWHIRDYKVFCIERSPYSKIISWANMAIGWDSYVSGGLMQATRSSLIEFFKDAFKTGRFATVRNIDLYRGPGNEIAAETLRYSELKIDFARFLNSIGVRSIPTLPHAKRGVMADTIDPRAVFRRDQLDQINEVFGEEFETFGYKTI